MMLPYKRDGLFSLGRIHSGKR